MESLNPKFALHGSKDKCTRTDTVFLPLSEVREWVVSLRQLKLCEKKQRGDGSTVSPAIQWMGAQFAQPYSGCGHQAVQPEGPHLTTQHHGQQGAGWTGSRTE